MTGLRVLVIGDGDEQNVCGVFRTSMYVTRLAASGIQIRFAMPGYRGGLGTRLNEATAAARAGRSEFDEAEVEAADVIVFRRIYRTHIACVTCDFRTWDVPAARAHGSVPGHHVEIGPHWLVRPLFERLEASPESLRGRAVVYETDDDLLAMPAANALGAMYLPDLDLVERMARLADLVTVSTPVLASRLRPFNERVRVVRNAVDPDWYGPRPAERPSGYPRILYFGSSGRLGDYEVCREAVDAVAARHPGTRRIWLGAPDNPIRLARLREVADEVLPYVLGVPAFCRALTAARPDIGLAPILDGPFERAKSELHWLDYSMAGAATVASRTLGEGPFRVVKPGIDGLLARGKRDWREAIDRLAASPALRDEIAGRARERVLAEYTVAVRAAEWEDAYRWAAEHAGERHAKGRSAAPAGTRQPSGRGAGTSGRVVPSRPAERVAAPSGRGQPASQVSPGGPPPGILAAFVAAQRFAHRSPLLLQLGRAGRSLDGWVTVDAAPGTDLQMDFAFGLPFGDRSVDTIYARNELADLGPSAMILFVEAARALRPGGVMRIVTRDRARFLERRERLASQGFVLSGRDAITPPFDSSGLLGMLHVAGFSSVRPAGIDESAAAILVGADSATGCLPEDDLLIVEAVR